eukprot:11237744-Alexandrium_andersonii.AAC.1
MSESDGRVVFGRWGWWFCLPSAASFSRCATKLGMGSVIGMVPWVKRIAKGLTRCAAFSTMDPMVMLRSLWRLNGVCRLGISA